MKTAITFLTFLFCLFGTAQTITEEMGGIQSNFEFYSDKNKLDVTKQILIERSTAKANTSQVENESYGYGYAYSDWRLEFISNTKVSSVRSTLFDDRAYRGQYKLTLKDGAGGVLFSKYLYKGHVLNWNGNIDSGPIYTYSIDLYGLPLVIFDDLAIVEIILID